MTAITHEQVTQTVLEQCSTGWKVNTIQDMPIPDSLSYAQDSQVWIVSILKQYSELGEEPAWLQGCDYETHLMYYQEMGELARTQIHLRGELVTWSDTRAAFFIIPCAPLPAERDGNGFILRYSLIFPDELSRGEGV